MFPKGNVKFKYRIVVNDDTSRPYRVEKKAWIFWHKAGEFSSMDSAERELRELAKLELMRPGTVVSVYTEQDFLVDKLKGN